jgi:outer membrane receptor for ferrienterochelin and colicin
MDKFSLVAGIRADHNSLYGWFGTPRLHLRYEPVKGTVIRLATGRGQRTANILAENTGIFVSSRSFRILDPQPGKAYGLNPEVAWNSGVTLDQQFSMGNRKGSISLDYYYTRFIDQVVVDMEDPRYISFYNLKGSSYSSSFQAEVNMELARKLELRVAWRFNDVRTTYNGVLLQRPLLARNRAFINLAWEKGLWKYDATVSNIGSKRIPTTSSNPKEYQMESVSPSYFMVNGQVSRYIGKNKLVEVYLGVENLTNYFQKRSILASEDPFGNYFDASLIWGPVYGRMFYSGFRWKIKKK